MIGYPVFGLSSMWSFLQYLMEFNSSPGDLMELSPLFSDDSRVAEAASIAQKLSKMLFSLWPLNKCNSGYFRKRWLIFIMLNHLWYWVKIWNLFHHKITFLVGCSISFFSHCWSYKTFNIARQIIYLISAWIWTRLCLAW